MVAAIASLQRGAVWGPQQVELLWASILRGFPIGVRVASPVLQGQTSKNASTRNTAINPKCRQDGALRTATPLPAFRPPFLSSC